MNIGTASTMPVARESSPLACSHAGKNGMTIPENPKKGA
jgi:hypothetical protein